MSWDVDESMGAVLVGLAVAAVGGLVAAGLAGGLAVKAVVSNIQISEHFTLRELTRSSKAEALQLVNIPTTAEVAALRRLATDLLEPIRQHVGPMNITSGFRTAMVNAAVGGSSTSDHTSGYAADFVPIHMSSAEAFGVLRAAVDNGDFPALDQLIFYPDRGHIHVGHALGPAAGDIPRRMVGISRDSEDSIEWL